MGGNGVLSSPAASVDTSLAQLVDELTARLRSGGVVDPAALAAEFPEHAEQLERLLPAMALLADVSRSAGRSAEGMGTPTEDGDEPVTGTLGDYRIVREVGRGGMGVVYEAEQISLGRRVALKVLTFASTMDAKHLQRFKNEARAAASLHHEHIVPVFGVGCERGVHFYAMQLIEGKSLAVFIRQLRGRPASSGGEAAEDQESASFHRPNRAQDFIEPMVPSVAGDATASYVPDSHGEPETPPAATEEVAGLCTQFSRNDRARYRGIAEMIAQAADALEHAHSLGIVHRDIKPGNLILDNAGQLWVTDFGLARFDSDADLTMTGDLLGTLRYMSPEQALAKHGLVDHRTDVYSLGATLYELLTLRPAMDGADKQEILKKIAFEEPQAPRSVDRTIPAELETITLKALAKEPAERYLTAGDLAEDLRRWLSNQTIKAKPPTLRQRLVKWGRRHPSLVGATGVVLLLTVAGLAVSNLFIGMARHEAEFALIRARKDRATARQVVEDLWVGFAEKWLSDQPALEQAQREFVQKALEYYEGLAQEEGDTPNVQAEVSTSSQDQPPRVTGMHQTPNVRADVGTVFFRLAVIHDRLGDLKKGDGAYTRAAEIFGGLAREAPNNVEYRYWHARSLAEHGGLCDRLGKGKDAEDLARRAFDLFQQAAQDFPNDHRIRAGLADCCVVLGSVNFMPGPRMNQVYDADYAPHRWTDCVSLLRRAIELYATVIESEPECRWRYHRAQKILSQVPLLSFRSLSEQERLSTESVAGLRALAAAFPRNHRPRTELCEALGWRGALLEAAGRPADAEAEHRRALQIADGLCQEYPSVPYYRTLQATTRLWLGNLLAAADRLSEAEPLLTQAAVALEATPEGHVPPWQLWNQTARCYRLLGLASALAGRFDDAERAYRRALEFNLRVVRNYQNSATWMIPNADVHRLAWLLSQKGLTDAATAVHRAHTEFWKEQTDRQPSDDLVCRAYGWSLNNMGVFLSRLGIVDEADQAYRESQSVHGKREEYRFLHRASEDDWGVVYHDDWTFGAKNRSWLYAHAGRLDAAEEARRELVQRAVEQLKSAPPGTRAQRKEVVNTKQDLAAFLDTLGRRTASIAAYKDIIRQLDRWTTQFPAEAHANDSAHCRMELAFVYQRAGNADDANRVADEAVAAVRRNLASRGKPTLPRVLAAQLADQGLIRWRTGRVEEAASTLADAVATMESFVADPPPASVRLLMGNLLAVAATRQANLMEETRQCAEAETGYVNVVSLRRRLAEDVEPGDWVSRERGEMNKYVGTRADWVRSLIELASFQLRRGQTEQAIDHCTEARRVLEEIVAAYPGDPAALNQLAWFLVTCPVQSLHDPARARRLAAKAVALHDSNDFFRTLGAAEFRAGDFRTAVAHLNVAIRRHNSLPQPDELFFRAMAHFRLGESEAARRDYDEGLRALERLNNPSDPRQQHREEAAALLGVK